MKTILQKCPRLVLVIAGLALFGFIREPIEDRLRVRLVEEKLLLPPPGQTAMEQMSQSALMGTLGGLRSLVAVFLTLEAYEHFSNKDWEQLSQTYAVITNLEPNDEEHWVTWIWHIGINATANMEIDDRLPEFERKRRFFAYALEAVDIAERGIKQNPESATIRMQLAEVYREKLKDNCATSRVYGDTIGLPDALPFVERFHGYFMARCEGKEQEAYDYLSGLYRESERNHLPTLIVEIKKLEKFLNIPIPQRIPDADPDKRPQKSNRKKPAPNELPGGLIIP
ncbi:hypothetical protein VSU19_06855 [Verrucomicrobiales bacterium BCK34]|nr:hypothetical protein [Verrucomicrobiales bacterium BCK34]